MKWTPAQTDIVQFSGEHRWLSNFWPAPVELDGVTYPTVEHAYVAAKSLDEGFRLAVRDCPTPGHAKRLGRTVELRGDWESEKLVIMENLLRQKFAPGSELAERLLATRGRDLIEGNSWNDRFWGVDYRTGLGENMLGRLLMGIRENLSD